MTNPPSRSRFARILSASTRMPLTMTSASDSALPARTPSCGITCHSICHSPALRSWPASWMRLSDDNSAPAVWDSPIMASEEIGLTFCGIVDDAPRWLL